VKFPEPRLCAARVVKGEFFTKLDVTCTSCQAAVGQPCRTFRLSPGRESSPINTAISWHAARARAWERWAAELQRRKCVRRVPIPEWVPWWAGEWGGEHRPRQGFVVVKSFRPGGAMLRSA